MTGDLILGSLAFGPIIAAIISYLIGVKNKTIRNLFVQAVVLIEAIIFITYLATGNANTFQIADFCGMGLNLKMDGFRALYGTIAAFMWAMTGLFSEEYFAHYRNRNRYYLFLLLTLGATEGVFLSADLYTTFIFFEMMSFTSYVWVVHEENEGAMRASETYLAVAVIGGLVMLMGLFLLYDKIGTLNIDGLKPAIEELFAKGNASDKTVIYAAGICMLFGFGAKAGMFPLQIWLPKAHPVAPAPASALLSGILTKAGIYGVLILCGHIFFEDGLWGSLILTLGTITMFIGALLAVFSIDLKRTLASSSVSQIGFILVGIGMSCLLGEENRLAVRGALLHMVNHSLIKLDLFMAAGVVYMNLHALDLNKIRGFGRGKKFLNAVFLAGALGIGGIPLFNGYVSKTLIHESIVEYIEILHESGMPAWLSSAAWFDAGIMKTIEWIFLISGGMTVAYMTKLYVCLFIEKNEDPEVQKKFDEKNGTYMNLKSKIALGLSAVLLPIMGFLPGIVMDKAADLGQTIMMAEEMEEKIAYFSVGNLKGAAISILIGFVLYFGFIRKVLMGSAEKEGASANSASANSGSAKIGGASAYLNLWPAWLDLENLVYRPILLKLLPFVFGVLCRILDSLMDWIVVLLRKTIYKDSPLPHEFSEGNVLTDSVGGLFDGVALLGERVHESIPSVWGHGIYDGMDIKNMEMIRGKDSNPNDNIDEPMKNMKLSPLTEEGKRKQSFRHRFAMLHEMLEEELFIMSRSMSFGLMLFCIGLVITVLYLLLA